MHILGPHRAVCDGHSIQRTNGDTEGSVPFKQMSFSEFVASLTPGSEIAKHEDSSADIPHQCNSNTLCVSGSTFHLKNLQGKEQRRKSKDSTLVGKAKQSSQPTRPHGIQQRLLNFITLPVTTGIERDATVHKTGMEVEWDLSSLDCGLVDKFHLPEFLLRSTSSLFPVQNFEDVELIRANDTESALDTIRKTYPHFPVDKCYTNLLQLKTKAALKEDTLHSLWTDKYAPSTYSSLLYNGHGVARFRRWLQRWKDNTGVTKSATNASDSPRCGRKRLLLESSDEEFVPESHGIRRRKTSMLGSGQKVPDEAVSATKVEGLEPIHLLNEDPCSSESSLSDAEEEFAGLTSEDDDSLSCGPRKTRTSWRTRAYVILGPPGTGKTALVYSLANELGFKVFELNSSVRRSGKDVLGQFQVAIDSHQVAKEHLSDSFSTFHMTSAAKTNQTPKRPRRSVANFFQAITPVPKTSKTPKSVKKKTTSTGTKGPKGLNLSCNSLLLLDEADVLFDSDRGFWSAVNNLLQLARRPIVLTASDPLLLQNLPIAVRVCRIKEPSSALIIPYLQILSLVEGLRLDSASAELMYQQLYDRPIYSPVDATSSTRGDLRKLINQLQWFASLPKDQASVSQPPCDKFSLTAGTLVNQLPQLCPLLCSIRLFKDDVKIKQVKQPEAERPGVDNAYTGGLSSLFTDERESPVTEVEAKDLSDEDSTDSPQSVLHVNSTAPLCRLLQSIMNGLALMSKEISLFDCLQPGFERSCLSWILDYTGCHPTDGSPLSVDAVQSTQPEQCSNNVVASRTIRDSNCTVLSNPAITLSVAPVPPFDDPDNHFAGYWATILSRVCQSRLDRLENELRTELPPKDVTSLSSTSGFPSRQQTSEPIYCSHLSKLLSDLNTTTGISRNLNTSSVCGRKSLVCDYLPYLRTIASGEATCRAISAKRRFFHYFDRINLPLRKPTRDLLASQSFKAN